MTWMIGDTQFQADDGGNPTAGPQLAAEAIGFGAALQQSGELSELLDREPASGPRWWPMPKSVRPASAGT